MLGSFPTWRVRVVASDSRFVRSAFSLAARSAQNARRVFPIRSQSLVMRYRVLYDERLDSIRMGQSYSKTNRAAVVLHIERVVREPQRFGESGHNPGVMIERVREFLWVRPATVSEARVVWGQ